MTPCGKPTSEVLPTAASETLDPELSEIQLCQAYGPVDNDCNDLGRPLQGVHCGQPGCGEADWSDHRLLPFEPFGPGEYVGPPRLPPVPEYRLRVDDLIDCVFRATREELSRAYQLEVGDIIKVESVNNPEVTREVQVQP